MAASTARPELRRCPTASCRTRAARGHRWQRRAPAAAVRAAPRRGLCTAGLGRHSGKQEGNERVRLHQLRASSRASSKPSPCFFPGRAAMGSAGRCPQGWERSWQNARCRTRATTRAASASLKAAGCAGTGAEHSTKTGPGRLHGACRHQAQPRPPPAARPLPPSRHQRPVQMRTAPTIRLPAPRARPPRADAEHGGRSGSKNEPPFSHPKQGKGTRISSRVPSRRASASKHLSRDNRKRAFKKVHEI